MAPRTRGGVVLLVNGLVTGIMVSLIYRPVANGQ